MNSHVGEVHILVVVRALMVFDNIMVVWGVVACLVVVGCWLGRGTREEPIGLLIDLIHSTHVDARYEAAPKIDVLRGDGPARTRHFCHTKVFTVYTPSLVPTPQVISSTPTHTPITSVSLSLFLFLPKQKQKNPYNEYRTNKHHNNRRYYRLGASQNERYVRYRSRG